MRKLLLSFFLIVLSVYVASAQRVLDDVLLEPRPDYGVSHFSAMVNNTVFIAGNSSFSAFDGLSVASYPYPERDGAQLKISQFFGGTVPDLLVLNATRSLPVLGSVIYLTLEDYDSDECGSRPLFGCPRYLYRFDGSITPTPITDPTLSNATVFQNKLYVVTDKAGESRLLSFDGSSVGEVLTSLGSYDLFTLFATDSFLYFVMLNSATREVTVKQFDGTVFLDIPVFSIQAPSQPVREVHESPDSGEVYFITMLEVVRFDGTSTDLVAEATEAVPSDFIDFTFFGGDAYIAKVTETRFILLRYDGELTEITLPDDAVFIGAENSLLVYGGKLYILARTSSGRGVIYTYDGSVFEPFVVAAADGETFDGVYEREGRMLITSNRFAYEYLNNILVCEIELTSGVRNPYVPQLNLSTDSFHMWSLWTSIDHVQYARYLMEAKTGCAVRGGVPDLLAELERMDLRTYGAERAWCWTGIDIGWVIDPLCPSPPFCLNPSFRVTARHSKGVGKLAFEQELDESTNIEFQLKDNKPYDIALDVFDGKMFRSVMLIDGEMVPIGFSGIGFSIDSKIPGLRVYAETENDQALPFRISVLGNDSQIIWSEQFVAPMDKQIVASVNEPVAAVQFSPVVKLPGAKLGIYPNPFLREVVLEISSAEQSFGIVTMRSMTGELVYQAKLESPGTHVLDVGAMLRPGLYILSVRVDGSEVRKLVQKK
jgi:hypothetical protein